MKISIEMSFFDGSSEKFEVSKRSFVIGRSEKADVVVTKEGFSREHCLVEYDDYGFHITDLNSTNGVRINNKDLPKNVRTAYDSFLPLSIGFAESVIFEVLETRRVAPAAVDEEIKAKIKKDDKNPTKEFKPNKIQKDPTQKIKKEKNLFILKMIFIILMAAAFVVYFFLNKDGSLEGDLFPSSPTKTDNTEGQYIEF